MTSKGVTSSMGGLDFVPAGAGFSASPVGHLKLQSFTGNTFYDATIAPDGSGTFDVSNATQTASVSGTPALAGMAYVTTGSPLFSSPSIFLDEFGAGQVVAFQADANGDPIVSTAQTFMSFTNVDGATIDPLTGDYLFSNGNGSVASNIAEAQGFALPEPGAWAMIGLEIPLLFGAMRWRQRKKGC